MGRELVLLLKSDREINFYPLERNNFEALNGSDVCIDFSHPSALSSLVPACADARCALLVGTSGLSQADDELLLSASKKIPVLKVANTSLGILALEAASQSIKKILGDDFDIEIFEMHHNAKRDAPSGTALALAKSLGQSELINYARKSTRTKGEIGVSSARGGDVIGDHTIFFLGNGERIELTHRAQSRALFAQGAIRLAKLLAGRGEGLYSSRDLFLS